jgi:hypothetical protein
MQDVEESPVVNAEDVFLWRLCRVDSGGESDLGTLGRFSAC